MIGRLDLTVLEVAAVAKALELLGARPDLVATFDGALTAILKVEALAEGFLGRAVESEAMVPSATEIVLTLDRWSRAALERAANGQRLLTPDDEAWRAHAEAAADVRVITFLERRTRELVVLAQEESTR